MDTFGVGRVASLASVNFVCWVLGGVGGGGIEGQGLGGLSRSLVLARADAAAEVPIVVLQRPQVEVAAARKVSVRPVWWTRGSFEVASDEVQLGAVRRSRDDGTLEANGVLV